MEGGEGQAHPELLADRQRIAQAEINQLDSVPKPKSCPLVSRLAIAAVPVAQKIGKWSFRIGLSCEVTSGICRHRKSGFLAALKIIRKQGLLCDTQKETEKAINQHVR